MMYHGGPKGRKENEYLLPPNETGAQSAQDLGIKGGEVCRKDRVYVTPLYAAAVMFACCWPEPTIYYCDPEGLEPDPDCDTPGLSFACKRAKVLKVLKPSKKDINIARGALLA